MAENHPQFHFEANKQQGFDPSSFLPYSYTDTPGVDQFELDLDSSLAGFQGLPAIVADPTPVFDTLRSEPYTCGPASAFTADSDSTYDSYSIHSGSVYHSPIYNTSSSTYSLPADFNFEFSKIQMDNISEYSSSQEINAISAALGMSTAYATPSPDNPSPAFSSSTFSLGSQSDYEPPTAACTPMLSSASDYMPSTKIGGRPSPRHQMTITPSSTIARVATSPLLPTVPLIPSVRSVEMSHELKEDSKKKFKCPHCSRAFARAFNLKTHRETHDPNRAKPHACRFPSCGRSFSRKHDLGRHMNSIHRVPPCSDIKAIGVERSSRIRCDGCGKNQVGGKLDGCDCDLELR